MSERTGTKQSVLAFWTEVMQSHNGILRSGSSLCFLMEATFSSSIHSTVRAVRFLFQELWWAGLKGETCLRRVFLVVRGFSSIISEWSTPVPHHTFRNMVKVAKMGQPSCWCCHMSTEPFPRNRLMEYSELEGTYIEFNSQVNDPHKGQTCDPDVISTTFWPTF